MVHMRDEPAAFHQRAQPVNLRINFFFALCQLPLVYTAKQQYVFSIFFPERNGHQEYNPSHNQRKRSHKYIVHTEEKKRKNEQKHGENLDHKKNVKKRKKCFPYEREKEKEGNRFVHISSCVAHKADETKI